MKKKFYYTLQSSNKWQTKVFGRFGKFDNLHSQVDPNGTIFTLKRATFLF
jgi:hypothetical protein